MLFRLFCLFDLYPSLRAAVYTVDRAAQLLRNIGQYYLIIQHSLIRLQRIIHKHIKAVAATTQRVLPYGCSATISP